MRFHDKSIARDIHALMSDGIPRSSGEIVGALGITEPKAKQNAYAVLNKWVKRGVVVCEKREGRNVYALVAA